jgi:transcription initiation factor TFIIIB Brf1 subunit/transcription initiation factor TFIIB
LRDYSRRIYSLSKGVESLSKEEHGLFFDAMQRLGLPNEVKESAISLYLDFKDRPIGEYNADKKNLTIFLIASVSLAAKALGDLRTDQEFQSKMFVSKEKLVDAEERILRSFGVENSVRPYSQLVVELTQRQIQSMAQNFAQRELVDSDERDQLIERSFAYLDTALDRGLSPKMSYRGRAAGLVFKAVRDLGIQISASEIARAAGFDEKSMSVNRNAIDALLKVEQ